MNRERARKLLPIIKAFSEGREIEIFGDNKWETIENPTWGSDIAQYRIKPESKLVPFTEEDGILFRDKWIKCKLGSDPGIMRIISYNDTNIHTEFRAVGYGYLLESYEFEDGLPCGKYVEE